MGLAYVFNGPPPDKNLEVQPTSHSSVPRGFSLFFDDHACIVIYQKAMITRSGGFMICLTRQIPHDVFPLFTS